MLPQQPSNRDNFEIAIICALPLEYDAVSYIFDEFWDEDGDQYGKAPGDPNCYTTGRIGNYNVVLALLPHMGLTSAASAAASMRSSYTGLQLALLVGVCGAVPRGQDDNEILLGDVVISKAVIHYDFGRQYPDKFVRKNTIGDSLGRPNKAIRNLLATLETDRGLDGLENRTAYFLQQVQSKVAETRRQGKYDYPGIVKDQLFKSTHRHKHRVSPKCICRDCVNESDPTCDEALVASCADLGCDGRELMARERCGQSGSTRGQPSVHLGSVASGHVVMKSATHRDIVAKETCVIAFEMEGAGVWDEVPSIVVKGVCDYADCHKHKGWQNFAAATAASATKAVLERYIRTDRSANAPVGEESGSRPGFDVGMRLQQSPDLGFLKMSNANTDQKLAQMLLILEGVASCQQTMVGEATAGINQSTTKREEDTQPYTTAFSELQASHNAMNDFIPLVQDLDKMRCRLALSPAIQHREGSDILHREDFRAWIRTNSSGLLWIDGYEVPGRPSWLADLALQVVHASLLSGYETLYSFNTVPHNDIGGKTPLALVRRYLKHLLRKYPEIRYHGDHDMLSEENISAAETDFDLSWTLFIECLNVISVKVVYIVTEAIDSFNNAVEHRAAYVQLLRKLSQLAQPEGVDGKVIKVVLMSVKPDSGVDQIFRDEENLVARNEATHEKVLIRISPAAARSRKQRTIAGKRRNAHTPREGRAFAGIPAYQTATVLTEDDFAPDHLERLEDGVSGANKKEML